MSPDKPSGWCVTMQLLSILDNINMILTERETNLLTDHIIKVRGFTNFASQLGRCFRPNQVSQTSNT